MAPCTHQPPPQTTHLVPLPCPEREEQRKLAEAAPYFQDRKKLPFWGRWAVLLTASLTSPCSDSLFQNPKWQGEEQWCIWGGIRGQMPPVPLCRGAVAQPHHHQCWPRIGKGRHHFQQPKILPLIGGAGCHSASHCSTPPIDRGMAHC